MYGGSPYYAGNSTVFNGLEMASQNAFQTAQSFIGAFTSVSMMLESTLFAVQNSVRAITSMLFTHFVFHKAKTCKIIVLSYSLSDFHHMRPFNENWDALIY